MARNTNESNSFTSKMATVDPLTKQTNMPMFWP